MAASPEVAGSVAAHCTADSPVSTSLEPLPTIELRIVRTDLDDPWLRWLHESLRTRLDVSVRVIDASPEKQAWPRIWALLSRLERRLSAVPAFPSCSPIGPDPEFARGGTGQGQCQDHADPDADTSAAARDVAAAAPTVRIVLDLTDASPLTNPAPGEVRWCLFAGGERVFSSNARIGYPQVESGAPVSELLVLDCSAVADRLPVLARFVQDRRPVGAIERHVLLGNVPRAVDKAIQHWRRGERLDTIDRCRVQAMGRATAPRSGAWLAHMIRLARAEGRQRLFNLRRRSGRRPGMWSLYVGQADALHAQPERFIECRPDADEYWADPFLWQRDGRQVVYYEAYDYRTMRGRLCVGELTDAGRFHVVGDVLSPAHHLSYPFLIEHRGELLMIPESGALECVEIWRCTRFPDRFERIATRFAGQAIVDLTLFHRAGQWWAFCSIGAGHGHDTNGCLYAFAVDSPMMRTIEPHARNPIVTDSRVARPAGRVFEQDGQWYRPSQDNSHGVYGHALNLMRIEVLTREDYRETRVQRFDAGFAPGLIGVHHLDVHRGSVVIDACHALGGKPSRHARQA